MMQLIHGHLPHWDASLLPVIVLADRLTLAKRRWRGIADDGQEFGFDLEHHLHDGDVFFQTLEAVYQIQQIPEPVLEIALATNTAAAAKLGWLIGNLHFPLEIADGLIRVADDPALRQLFEREHIVFSAEVKIFHPLSGGHRH